MQQVLGPCVVVDQYVIKKYEYEFAQERFQYRIHQCLKCGRGICQTERHDQKLEQALMSVESRLLPIIRVHAHLVIPRAEIQLREELGTPKLIQQFLYHRDGEFIFYCVGIQSLIVNTEVP